MLGISVGSTMKSSSLHPQKMCWSVGTDAATLLISADGESSCPSCSNLGLLDLSESWSYRLSPVSSFLTCVHLDVWRLQKSWRNILIYDIFLNFSYRESRIKCYCCILFSHFGTRICILEVGFVLYTHVVIYFCMLYFVLRVFEGCWASCFHFPQSSGKRDTEAERSSYFSQYLPFGA